MVKVRPALGGKRGPQSPVHKNTAFLLRMSRKFQYNIHLRIRFWIKSALEDKPQVVPAWLMSEE